MVRFLIQSIVFLCCLSVNASEHINLQFNDQYSQSSYGGIGLIQTPTARFSNDGEFGFGVSAEEPYNRLYAKMQFFPWMEAVLKYTEGTHRPYNAGSHQTWKDKGFDVKFRLLEEKSSIPSVVMGLRDVGGTGFFSSEYFAGRTPNPCIRCNSYVKWDAFIDQADQMGIEYIATGHYATIKQAGNQYFLKKGIDDKKDQSYVLWGIPKETLKRTIFPIGDLTKMQVREIARKNNLATANSPESM